MKGEHPCLNRYLIENKHIYPIMQAVELLGKILPILSPFAKCCVAKGRDKKLKAMS